VRRAAWIVLLGALVLTGLAACSSSSAKPTPAAAPTNLRGHATVEIDARNYLFTPADVVVDVGTLVTFHNTDSVAHNVKKSADALDFGGAFGTNVLNPNASYSFTFSKVGTFPYTCTIHAGMTGKIQVLAPG
jgi:plastocyanin